MWNAGSFAIVNAPMRPVQPSGICPANFQRAPTEVLNILSSFASIASAPPKSARRPGRSCWTSQMYVQALFSV